jgi:hypothetical protein
MIDIFNLPDTNNNVKVFYSTGSNNWQIWQKPRNCKFVNMFLIGGGGGGAGGDTGTGSAYGGGGGGSSSITSGIFLANVLPDTLYIQVGIGGNGGVGQIGASPPSDGFSGTLSYVSVFPSATTSSLITNTNPIVLASGNVAAGGGFTTSTYAGGSAGTSFSQTSPSFNVFSYLGVISVIGGQAGGAGGTPSITAPNITITSLTSGGAGGGGGLSTASISKGGNITGVGNIPTISGGTTLGEDGNHGYTNLPLFLSGNKLPLFFTGGAGGGSSNITITGTGGNGSFGCGGGGGGGGTGGNPVTHGVGGRGGDGLVIITCW